MRNQLHNVAIVYFYSNAAPTTLAGPMTAARIIEECAHHMAHPVSTRRATLIKVFASTGLDIVNVRYEDDEAKWVPVCHPKMDKPSAALYAQLGSHWDQFRKAYAYAKRQFARH